MKDLPTLPNAKLADVSEKKVKEYLLCMDHPDGYSKARFFMRFGFSLEHWDVLRKPLKSHGSTNRVANLIESPYGSRYVIEGRILTPDGRNPMVRTIWIIEKGHQIPRLITAHPV